MLHHTTVADLTLGLLLLVAAFTDFRHRKIYNALTYPTAMWALLVAAVISVAGLVDVELHWLGGLGLNQSLCGALFGGLLMLVPYALSRGGAGDVKLAVAMGALIGFEALLWTLALGYILAASWVMFQSATDGRLVALLIAIWKKTAGGLLKNRVAPLTREEQRDLSRPVPLAGFFAMSAALLWIA